MDFNDLFVVWRKEKINSEILEKLRKNKTKQENIKKETQRESNVWKVVSWWENEKN